MAKIYTNRKGYKIFANSGKSVHRWMAEKKLGRPLKSNEVVHHRDEDKGNFRMGNLGVISRSFHAKLHNKKKNGKWFW
ncbi:MAG TPA: HNH endonuclease [Candidatus Nanoarchaeia archaeon]|nr:HNH endonuclease [Candidatus Woesearchaeota archaeon]HLC55959.1 HNH endonuclease [Candidatus Nanoarchaeia archaeon]